MVESPKIVLDCLSQCSWIRTFSFERRGLAWAEHRFWWLPGQLWGAGLRSAWGSRRGMELCSAVPPERSPWEGAANVPWRRAWGDLELPVLWEPQAQCQSSSGPGQDARSSWAFCSAGWSRTDEGIYPLVLLSLRRPGALSGFLQCHGHPHHQPPAPGSAFLTLGTRGKEITKHQPEIGECQRLMPLESYWASLCNCRRKRNPQFLRSCLLISM